MPPPFPPRRIFSRRLSLAIAAPEDAGDFFALLTGDLAIARNTARIPVPYQREHADAFMQHAGAAFAAGVEYVFAARLGGALVACCGVTRKDGAPAGEWDLGYWVGAPFRGRGIASEAGTTVVGYARDHLGADAATAEYFIDNPASGAVLRRIGFAPSGERATRFSLGRGGAAEAVRMRMSLRAAAP